MRDQACSSGYPILRTLAAVCLSNGGRDWLVRAHQSTHNSSGHRLFWKGGYTCDGPPEEHFRSSYTCARSARQVLHICLFFAFIPALILPAFRALRRREVLRPFRTLFIRADLFAGLAGSLSIGVVSLVPWLWLPVFFDHALLRLTRRAVGPRFLQRDNYYFFIQSLSLQHGAAIPWRDTSHYLHPHPSPLSISLVGILDRCPSEST